MNIREQRKLRIETRRRFHEEQWKKHYEAHHKNIPKEFKVIHRYLRYLRPLAIILNLLIIYFIFKWIGYKTISIIVAGLFIVREVIEIYMLLRIDKRIIKPIERLKKGLEEVSRGNYDVKVQNTGFTEVSVLIFEFNKMVHKLKESEKSKSVYEENRKALVANISHDLKTPITSISGYVEAILDGVVTSPEKINNYLKTIHNNVKYINNLIDDLFLFSKLDMQKLDFKFQSVKIKPFMADLMEEFEFILGEKYIEFHYEDNVVGDLQVNIDGKRIYQTVRNIMGNAVKYGQKDGLAINVNMSNSEGPIKLEIADNGPGIPEDKLPFVFDRFYRIDTERTKDLMSTGLGLAIAKELIEAHGGKISVSSVISEGSVFTIILPVQVLNGEGGSNEANIDNRG